MSASADTRPIREIISARARTRSHIWLLVIFVLLRCAEVADWLYFHGGQARTPLSEVYLHQEMTGWLAAQALLTTVMLVGLWYRERWVRALLKTWLTVEMIVSGIAMAGAVYTWSVFPSTLLIGAALRVIVLFILSYPRDMRLFLSTSYMETYTTLRREPRPAAAPVYTSSS